LAYGVLTANAAMSDGGLLFNVTAATTTGGHQNLSGTSDAISVTSVAAGMAAMRNQVGINTDEMLDIQAAFLLVPPTKELLAMQTVNSPIEPGAAFATVNPLNGRLRVIANPRLTSTAWYLAADPRQIDTVKVYFLEGMSQPQISEEDSFDTDARKYKVKHAVVANDIDHRGLYKNPGA